MITMNNISIAYENIDSKIVIQKCQSHDSFALQAIKVG